MTVTEIAQRAGVSKACVSRYFNHGYVSEEKREKIRQVIEETGYIPNRGGQGGAKRSTIAVIIPKINSESISRMVSGISNVLYREDYRMLLADTENSIEKELFYLQSFQQDNLDGLIFVATFLTRAHEELLRQFTIPVVILGQKFEEYSCVYHDDYGAARAMAERLVAAGRTRIGAVLVTDEDQCVGVERTRGYTDALRAAGLPAEERRIVRSEFTLESGYDAAQKLMEQAPDTDGIFCATDTIAIGVIQYLRAIGKRIPQDVAVSGIGHSRMTEIVEPHLTTAHLFYQSTGVEGADMLIKMIHTGIDMKKKLKMGYEVVVQESV